MKQYVIIARDGKDEEALERRMAARPTHLSGAAELKANNNLIAGGAILSAQETMMGSVMIVQFETEEDFQQWFDNEPYITKGVWEQVEVLPFKVASV